MPAFTRYGIIVLNCLLALKLSATADYRTYYRLVNVAEETFVNKRDKSCLAYYDSAFSACKKPYVKDIYIAAQICYYLGDTSLFLNYTGMAFKNGLPLSSIRSAPILRNIDHSVLYPKIKALYARYNDLPKPDLALREEVLKKCYESDSIKMGMGRDQAKIQAFYNSENAFRDYLFESCLSKGIFPNEHLVGIATDTMYQAFLKRNRKKDLYGAFYASGPFASATGSENDSKTDYELLSKYALSVLIHSKCAFWKYRKQLWQAVLNGYMQPKEYGLLHETSVAWNQDGFNSWDNCSISRQQVYYNILGYDPRRASQTFGESAEQLKTVEANRRAICMQKYSVDLQKKKLQAETGLWFFYDFLDRPN